MKKLFGEYLVEKEIVTAEQVLLAVMDQLRSSPSIAEVVFDHKLLGSQDQLQILAHQQFFGIDYRSSAEKLDLWQPKVAEVVEQKLRLIRRPLGEIMCSLGYLSLQQLTDALNDYIHHLQQCEAMAGLEMTEKKAGGREASVAVPLSPIGKTAAATQTGERKEISEVLIREFLSHFRHQIMPNMQSLLSRLDNEHLSLSELNLVLAKAVREVAEIRAAASFLGARILAGNAEQLEQSLHSMVAGEQEVDTKLLKELISCSIHIYNSLSQSLEDFGIDEPLASNANLLDLLARQERIKHRLVGGDTAPLGTDVRTDPERGAL